MACILIEVNEQGQASIGSYPSEQIPPEIKQSLQPVESVDLALEQARSLLTEEQPDGQTESQETASFEKGYEQGRGTPMFEGV